MIVVTLSKCPNKLRGDLTKWLIEIDTGVYVGNLNSKVRDALWERITDNIKNGRATMVYSTNGEQKLDFRIHNSDWEPIDYDGITLVRHNKTIDEAYKNRIKSKASINKMNATLQRNKKPKNNEIKKTTYVAIDIETTGLEPNDKIIEIAAIRVQSGKMIDSFSRLITIDKKLPKTIVQLTGLTDEMLLSKGVSLQQALKEFLGFCDNNDLIGHNINKFDMIYLQRDCKNNGFPLIKNKTIDTINLARKKIDNVSNYKLESLAKYFNIEITTTHRALDDTKLVQQVYEKLKEI